MNIVGLEMGGHSFKAVELKKEKDKIELVRYGLSERHNLTLNTDSEEDLDKYANGLADFFDDNHFSTPNVVAALPETSVFTRIIKVPKMSDKELKSAITYEAEQYIPLPLKDVSFDFQIFEDDSEDKSKMNVLLVAATKTLIEKYVRIIKKAKLVPTGLEPETLAIARVAGDKLDQPNPSIIVCIASNETNVIITYKGVVRFTRNISTGGDSLTRAIAQNLGFDFSQAEEYKKTYGIDPKQVDGKVYNSIKPVFDIILNEIKRAYFFYTTHNPSVTIRRVVVCGGSALMPGLLYYLTTNLDLEVELANPWEKIAFPQKLEKDRQRLLDIGPYFVSSVGLAIKEL